VGADATLQHLLDIFKRNVLQLLGDTSDDVTGHAAFPFMFEQLAVRQHVDLQSGRRGRIGTPLVIHAPCQNCSLLAPSGCLPALGYAVRI